MMRKCLFPFLILIVAVGVVRAEIVWEWSFADEVGEFITDSQIVCSGKVSSGTYTLVDGERSFSVISSSLPLLAGSTFKAGKGYGGKLPLVFDWDGHKVVKWDCSCVLGIKRDWLTFRSSFKCKYDYIFGFDDQDKKGSFASKASLYDNSKGLSIAKGEVSVLPIVYCGSEIVSDTLCCNADKKVEVYILAGQSNVDGRAVNSEFPVEFAKKRSDVQIYFDGKWNDLGLGLNNKAKCKLSGPEVAFGRCLADRNKTGKVVLIKSTLGATSLYENWKPETGQQWKGLIEDVSNAMASIPVEGEVELAGFVWMQGENDTLKEDVAKAYEKNLSEFIKQVREQFSKPDLPFVLGQISQAPTYPNS